MDDVTLPSVCAPSRLEEIANDARARLVAIGPLAEQSTMELAAALHVNRAELMASMVPAQERGEVASRTVAGKLVWRIERRHT